MRSKKSILKMCRPSYIEPLVAEFGANTKKGAKKKPVRKDQLKALLSFCFL